MAINDEFFVGCFALSLSMIATAIALGPWTAPYQIRSMLHLQREYGKPVARMVWLMIAIISGSCSVAILSGFRPDYASPVLQSDSLQ